MDFFLGPAVEDGAAGEKSGGNALEDLFDEDAASFCLDFLGAGAKDAAAGSVAAAPYDPQIDSLTFTY